MTRQKQVGSASVVFMLLVGLAACGGMANGGSQCSETEGDPCLPTISPTQASIKMLETVQLQAQTPGFTDRHARWWEDESLTERHLTCAFTDSSRASFDSCPYGYVVYNATQPPYLATYYASTNPGIYHVGFSADPDNGNGPGYVFGQLLWVLSRR